MEDKIRLVIVVIALVLFFLVTKKYPDSNWPLFILLVPFLMIGMHIAETRSKPKKEPEPEPKSSPPPEPSVDEKIDELLKKNKR